MAPIFRDRADAGQVLASRLNPYARQSDVLVLGLPRGGVPVARAVARALGLRLDVFLVRKLGVPGHEELAMGAIASGGVRVLNTEVVAGLRISEAVIEDVAAAQGRELERRERAYRGDRPPAEVRGLGVILVDDGMATGATMRAAVAALRPRGPRRIVVAVPVAALPTCREFADEVDEVICAFTPDPFYAVGLWYRDFAEMSDAEIARMLAESWAESDAGGDAAAPA
jgi:predicted phosphoribosyltransferase